MGRSYRRDQGCCPSFWPRCWELKLRQQPARTPSTGCPPDDRERIYHPQAPVCVIRDRLQTDLDLLTDSFTVIGGRRPGHDRIAWHRQRKRGENYYPVPHNTGDPASSLSGLSSDPARPLGTYARASSRGSFPKTTFQISGVSPRLPAEPSALQYELYPGRPDGATLFAVFFKLSLQPWSGPHTVPGSVVAHGPCVVDAADPAVVPAGMLGRLASPEGEGQDCPDYRHHGYPGQDPVHGITSAGS
jgi:hypothetical protein